MDQEIKNAIRNKRLIGFSYHGLHRVAEPHVYGVHDGKVQLLSYQVAGDSSSGGLPNWRRVELEEVTSLTVLEDRFPGRRPNPSGKHSEFDTVIAVVD